MWIPDVDWIEVRWTVIDKLCVLLGHRWVKKPTPMNVKVCSRCGYYEFTERD